ncbi:MAG TPA: phosphate ABC transporter permease subunit PstC [Actinomycetota bacterium]|nr:phosphate ABC transporter permease subunit PstC [Actinomycetota bacterium]
MAVSASPVDEPRTIHAGAPKVDRVFHGSVRTVAIIVLVVFGSIGLFLGKESISTFHQYGVRFLTESDWEPSLNRIGISATLLGTVLVAIVALVIAFPLALATALYISEYAPARLKPTLVSLVDMMAAVPSIIYAAWGFFLLMPRAQFVAHWLHQNLGFIPIFRVDTDPNAAPWAQARYTGSMFIAGIVVSMMVLPIACAVMRGVFAQAPIGEREAAYALGGTRWGMIRSVVLPFGRGGIIGGTMLGLGRALGETVAVAIILSTAFDFKFRVLENGGSTISKLIAERFGDATTVQLSALLAAGFVLFVMTLMVNTVAAVFISRSRSGAATEA